MEVGGEFSLQDQHIPSVRGKCMVNSSKDGSEFGLECPDDALNSNAVPYVSDVVALVFTCLGVQYDSVDGEAAGMELQHDGVCSGDVMTVMLGDKMPG